MNVRKTVESNKLDPFLRALKDTIAYARQEDRTIRAGGCSEWNAEQLEKIVLPEMNELLAYAVEGNVFFKYGERHRLLESSYLLTDSFENLSVTALGRKITELQELYNSL